MGKGVSGLLACIISLVAIVVIVLYQESDNREMVQKEARESFQIAVGGMGIGAITVPAWNFGDYDPRLQPGGYDRIYPLPGGYSYSPDRLTMVTSF